MRNSRMNQPQPNGRRKPPLLGLRSISVSLFAPEPVVPAPQFLARNLPVFGSGVKAGVAKVLLQESESVTRVIQLHRVDGEGVSQAMRTYIVYLPRVGID